MRARSQSPRQGGSLIGPRIQQLRTSRGESLSGAAEKLSLAKSYLSDLERGKATNVGSDVIVRIAKHYQCSSDFLLGIPELQSAPSEDFPTRLAEALLAAVVSPSGRLELVELAERFSPSEARSKRAK